MMQAATNLSLTSEDAKWRFSPTSLSHLSHRSQHVISNGAKLIGVDDFIDAEPA
jgi:hypothetical protein